MIITRRRFFKGIGAVAAVALVSSLPTTVRAWEPVRKLGQNAWLQIIREESRILMPWADMVKAEIFDFGRQVGIAAEVGNLEYVGWDGLRGSWRHAVRLSIEDYTVSEARKVARDSSMALTEWFRHKGLI